MRRTFALIVVLFAAACDSPSPEFARAPAIAAEAGGSAFTVRILGDHVEAIRTTTEWAPSLETVAPRALAAIETASGCRVAPGTLEGDAAVIRARLDC